MPDFDFAILGAGAMGSIVGAHLARAGHKVAMLARGERANHLERHGLTIEGLASFTAAVQVLRDPADLHSAGALIVAMKTPGTLEALAALRHARFGVTLSIQNGLLKNELLESTFGKERVLGALADTSGELLPSGAVLFTRNVNILLGELDGSDTDRARRLARTIDEAGVRTAATTKILTLEWSKFCSWVGLIALAVTTRAYSWQYLLDPACALVLARLVREMGTLAGALGVELSDHAILPTATLCSGSEEMAVEAVMRAGREYRANAPQHRMSALQDLLAGRPLEVNETFGYATNKARALGLSLRLVECFELLLAGIDRTQRKVPPAAPA